MAVGGKNDRRLTPALASREKASLDNIVEKMLIDDDDTGGAPTVAPDMEAEDHAPVVMLVFALLKEALKRNASDIHVEPEETGLRIRFRIDGVLQEVQRLPKKLVPIIVSRLKIMGELDITERRIPQDGCIRMRAEDAEADFRMSTLPSVFGEKTVLRVMNRNSLDKKLDEVGMPDFQLEILRKSISKPDGLVLVTGPTGSGKTTTLYAALAELNNPERSIFTAEDPVEGTMKGVTQVQTNTAVGYNFSTVLRSLLRQDPDIILVGEIRDKDTIDIAMKAAMTGHLVLSSLHTNDTASTVQRMLNMGVEPYLITSSVTLIVAQRLVRKICGGCKDRQNVDPMLLRKFGVRASQLSQQVIYQGKGCEKCGGTGYSGRVPIYEMMPVDDKLKEGILRGASSVALKKYARQRGMVTLREAGIAMILQGHTTLQEVLAKTNADDEEEDVLQSAAPSAPTGKMRAIPGVAPAAGGNGATGQRPVHPAAPAAVTGRPKV